MEHNDIAKTERQKIEHRRKRNAAAAPPTQQAAAGPTPKNDASRPRKKLRRTVHGDHVRMPPSDAPCKEERVPGRMYTYTTLYVYRGP